MSKITKQQLQSYLWESANILRGKIDSGDFKHKYIYLNPSANGIEFYEGVRDYIKYYNKEKVHHTIKEVPAERYLRSKNENNQYQPQILTKTESPV